MTLHEMHALTTDDQHSMDSESGALSAVWSIWFTCVDARDE